METYLIIISCILGSLMILYIVSVPILSSHITILTLFLLQLFSIFVLVSKTKEDFFFEVSPQKQQCMNENVSLQQPPGKRSDGCCPIYTVGGKLKYVEEWKENTDNPIHWQRTDNWVDSEKYNSYQTQLAPTALVKK